MTSTVCLIAKNEERALAEWLAYQCVIGFDRILVYDNGSTDATASIVHALSAKEPSISYRAWPDKPGQRPQHSAYADAVGRCETDWLAFFDTDEFIVIRKFKTINAYLDAMPAEVSGIAINWMVFGSGGQQTATPGLVIERFTTCAPARHGKNKFIKSIVRPKAVGDMLVHAAKLRYGHYSDSLGRPVDIDNYAKTFESCFEGAQLNHYLLKSREEFALKRARGHSGRAPEEKDKYTHIDEEFWRAHDLNDARDVLIASMVGPVREKLRAWDLRSTDLPTPAHSVESA
jgi:glycosyltransferase involved in cell wall biosynthesis